jgi:hypothetical protein
VQGLKDFCFFIVSRLIDTGVSQKQLKKKMTALARRAD